ncbi:MAG: SDR family NAD(P)-dependent oxidoreductase [Bacteroidota bacterium]|nr:SDR family NAD(P)-dependent oxidoreductase [Bacteroidota bacterium]
MMSLQGKNAIITGASSGIGKALTLALLGQGVNVAACARSQYRLDELREASGALPGTLLIGSVDVADEGEMHAFAEKANMVLGPVSIVVANAGFGVFKPLVEMKAEEFDQVMATNVRGVWLTLRETVPGMVERREGDVVIVSSLAGKNGFAGGTAYSGSKFAVRGIAQSLMHEVREHDVRVLAVFPGSTDTRFFDGTPMSPKRERILRAEDVSDAILHALLAPRRALSSEIDIRPANPR